MWKFSVERAEQTPRFAIDGEMHIVEANQAFRELTGYDMRCGNYLALVHPQDRAQVMRRLREYMEDGGAVLRHRLAPAAGSSIWVDCQIGRDGVGRIRR